MLDTLDKVNWNRLSHAYGEASDVPALLRALASDQKEVWDDALSQLYGNIWHQGTVYQATAYAAPFLIELLEVPSVVCKAQILYLLQVLACGSSYLDVHQDLDWFRNERMTEEFQARREEELGYVRAAHVAALEGISVYLQLLAHPEASVRLVAPYLLGGFAERTAEIEPALSRRFDAESDPEVKASLLMAIVQLRRGTARRQSVQIVMTTEQQDYIAKIYRDQAESPVVRFVAALSALESGGGTVIEQTMPVLRDNVEICRQAYSRLPWGQGGSPLFAVSAALSSQPELRLQWLLEMLARRDPNSRQDAVWDLGEMCRQRRTVPQTVVPYLAKLVADADPAVRQRAASLLPELGRARHLAVDRLETFVDCPDPEVRALAAKTLEKVREGRDKYDLKNWLRKPSREKDVAELIETLEEQGRSRYQVAQNECVEAAAALEALGAPARDAVPALRKALRHEYHWLRVRAARALWRITQDADEVLPVLLEELRCRPAGFLVAGCLGEMGYRAEAAIPALRRIIDSEVRLVEIGTHDEWVDEDEAFCEIAQRALARIEADLTSSQ